MTNLAKFCVCPSSANASSGPGK